MTLDRSRSFCKCLFQKIAEKYSYEDAVVFSEQIGEELKNDGVYKSCAVDSGMNWNSINGVYLGDLFL